MRAVIDVGSNSVLLVVARQDGDRWEPVFESSEVTGLGRGTKTSGRLSEEGIVATLAAVRRGFEQAKAVGAPDVVAAATMAARIASNTEDFLARATAQGTPVVVLSGDDEARLGFDAVARDPVFSGAERLTIVDVGGHSTELVTANREGRHWAILHRKSYPVGALGLREGVLVADTPDRRCQLAAVVQIDDTIGLRYLPRQCGTVVTLGATGTNLVTVREKMTSWDPGRVHGSILGYEEVSKAVEWLSSLGDTGRAALPGIEKGREHTIHAGALILERAMFALGAETSAVSVRGWRHALLEEG